MFLWAATGAPFIDPNDGRIEVSRYSGILYCHNLTASADCCRWVKPSHVCWKWSAGGAYGFAGKNFIPNLFQISSFSCSLDSWASCWKRPHPLSKSFRSLGTYRNSRSNRGPLYSLDNWRYCCLCPTGFPFPYILPPTLFLLPYPALPASVG